MQTMTIPIAGRLVGGNQPPYVVAELSANHGGRLETALETVAMAKAQGADAVKLQTYTADTITLDHDSPEFRIKGGLWDGRRLYDLYQEAHTPWDWHAPLFARARELGITMFSTPFDDTAVDLLQSLKAPAYKVASFELIDHPLIERVAATGKPVIMSTGMASLEEIDESVAVFRNSGGRELILLHCISGYPTPAEQSNLRKIPMLAERYKCAIGLSDHTLGTEVSIAAVALGACFIEKHVALRRADGGPDAAFSLEPDELRALVYGARTAHAALGSGVAARSEVESGNLMFRRSIYVVRDIRAGEPFTNDNVRIIRPGFGLPPKQLPSVIGRRTTRDLARGTALAVDMIDLG